MTGVSVMYWIGVIAVLLSTGFLIKKLFSKPDEAIVNKLDQTLKANNKELTDTLVKLLDRRTNTGNSSARFRSHHLY